MKLRRTVIAKSAEMAAEKAVPALDGLETEGTRVPVVLVGSGENIRALVVRRTEPELG